MRPEPTDTRVELLASVPLFRGCNGRQLVDAAELVEDLDVAPGAVLMAGAGDPERCYIVIAGEARASLDGTEVARLGPGDYFGEPACAAPSLPPGATVTAVSAMRLLALQPTGFAKVLGIPAVAERVALAAGGGDRRTA